MEFFTELIDLPRLIFNTLWVLGFSIIAAALSLTQFEGKQLGIPLRQMMKSNSFQLPLWIALTLVTIGFAGNASQWWERAVWIVLTLLNLLQLYFAAAYSRSAEDR